MSNRIRFGIKIGKSGAAEPAELIAGKVTNLDTKPKADHLES